MGRKKIYDDGDEARSSKWAFCMYPDSAPEDWYKRLSMWHVPMAVSPLHDADKNGDETEKKKHWHVMIDFSTLKAFHQVEAISKSVNGCCPIILLNPTGYYRYLTHRDNPEKAQYEWSDIKHLSGFNYDKYQGFSETEIDAIFIELTDIIDERKILEYSDLLKYVKDPEHDKLDYVRLVRKNTVFFNAYITSVRNKIKKMEEIKEKKKDLDIEEFKKWQQMQKLRK